MKAEMEGQKAAVAMSGGVDSSVAAALLLEQGLEVIGVTMLHYDSNCRCAEQAVDEAFRVCRALSIEHHVLDLRNEFKETVIEYFVREYLAGRTPNPCVLCNPTIKWGKLMSFALSLGADYFATGHYVNLRLDAASGRYQLVRSRYRAKDQSYALWRLSQQQLSRTLFPLADWRKEDVRRKAAELGLPVARKIESQDICFIPDHDYVAYLREKLGESGQLPPPGDLVDAQNRILGRHRGYPFYTIGQRKGLGIALGRPQYVIKIDADRNRVRVGNKEELLADGLSACEVNWVSIAPPTGALHVTAHIRYNDPGYSAVLHPLGEDRVKILFDQPRMAVTPGQSVVFYAEDLLLGGGVIEKAIGRGELHTNLRKSAAPQD
ncbi:MAG: tRNA 2-thiouridine(34) synthase MnmA [candidate division KSB1 bacterium]|nr:tRNA 2-thiouridine(34) synthase MnmA [candidate division KSB1 bacterium]